MNKIDLNEWRKARLGELSEKVGGNTELGKMLGLKSGAFIGQMRDGIRPITEKTIQKIHGIRGYSGWFERHEPVFLLDPEAVEMVKKYAYLLGHAKATIRRQAHAAAIEALLGFLSENGGLLADDSTQGRIQLDPPIEPPEH